LFTLRKQNAAVVLAAHSIEQVQSAPYAAVIWESCPTRIFLPNADAGAPATAALYAQMGLGEREIATIARRDRKRSTTTGRHWREMFDLTVAHATPWSDTL
jgi:type IV secretion system protein VirB4